MTVRELIEALEAVDNKELPVGFAYWTEEDDDLDSRLRVVEDGVYIGPIHTHKAVILQSRY